MRRFLALLYVLFHFLVENRADLSPPFVAGCTKLELECSYTQAAPPTERVQAKAYASALQARVQELESVVDELQSRLRLYETPETVSTSSTAAEDQLAHGLNRLKVRSLLFSSSKGTAPLLFC